MRSGTGFGSYLAIALHRGNRAGQTAVMTTITLPVLAPDDPPEIFSVSRAKYLPAWRNIRCDRRNREQGSSQGIATPPLHFHAAPKMEGQIQDLVIRIGIGIGIAIGIDSRLNADCNPDSDTDRFHGLGRPERMRGCSDNADLRPQEGRTAARPLRSSSPARRAICRSPQQVRFSCTIGCARGA